jgi:putative restriction endonuclease
MRFWVGVTNIDWYRYQAGELHDEVNFWQPSERAPFLAPPAGMPFLFKLKSPINKIAGFGLFSATSVLPVGMAWDVFGPRNGAPTLQLFQKRLGFEGPESVSRPMRCTVLSDVYYLPESEWFDLPDGAFPSNVVVGKFFDTDDGLGHHVIARVMNTLQRASEPLTRTPDTIQTGFGQGRWVEPRLGQGAFRTLVTDAYERRCAITGENTLIALDAAHIRPYADEQCHDVQNGLLLRADFHKLFDNGLISITPDLTVRVSPQIANHYFNGKVYYRLDGAPLAQLPSAERYRPDPKRLAWHYEVKFQH